jgi:hypothetical protein
MYRLCVVCAPIGSGVSTLLREYAARVGGDVRYVDVQPGMTEGALRDAVTAGDAAAVVLDHVDLAEPAAIDAVLREAAWDGAFDRQVIVGAHARRLIHAHDLVAYGRAPLIDASDLAFRADEIAEFAAALGVSHDADDVRELLHLTEGWPLAVGSILRDAAQAGRSMRGAFENWAERHGFLLLEFIENTPALASDTRVRFSELFQRGNGAPQRELAALESLGCPIVRTRTGYRLNRILARLARESPGEESAEATPLDLTVLGRFHCAVGEREVAFARRRDRNVLSYIALSPDAAVSRLQLLGAFWPGLPPAVASQGLRTTLSRLRRAIASAAGHDAGRYLDVSGSLVALRLESVRVDARRFAHHVVQGRRFDERGDWGRAREHYEHAAELYAGRLLSSEAAEPALEPRVTEFSGMSGAALERLTQLRAGWTQPVGAARLA